MHISKQFIILRSQFTTWGPVSRTSNNPLQLMDVTCLHRRILMRKRRVRVNCKISAVVSVSVAVGIPSDVERGFLDTKRPSRIALKNRNQGRHPVIDHRGIASPNVRVPFVKEAIYVKPIHISIP